jgi:nucleotide-binding universal stress UspA family protein
MPRGEPRRILHASDFSSASRAAFTKAVELARANRAQLLLLHVRSVVVPMVGDGYVSPQAYEQLDRASRAAAKKQLDRLVAQAKKRGVRTKGLLALGVAHEQIARAARGARADMIVMGTHGRTGVSKFFLGSVAGRVVSLAACPVLTVRGK